MPPKQAIPMAAATPTPDTNRVPFATRWTVFCTVQNIRFVFLTPAPEAVWLSFPSRYAAPEVRHVLMGFLNSYLPSLLKGLSAAALSAFFSGLSKTVDFLSVFFSSWHDALITEMQLVEMSMQLVGIVMSPDNFVLRRSISS
jgi:hypothetical protein